MANTDDKKSKIQIHIVSSVKGGCGKTAFSLFKALELANTERKYNLENKYASVIWIDADFKGTASKPLFYGENEEMFKTIHSGYTIEELQDEIDGLFETSSLSPNNRLCFSSEYIPYTINDYLKEEIEGPEKMIIHGYAFSGQKAEAPLKSFGCINGLIDFVFSSGHMSDKKLFNYGSGLPTIEIGRFTYLMKVLLSRSLEMGRIENKAVDESIDIQSNYKHIIIDMPPGDDAYSSALLSTIRQLAEEKQGDRHVEIEIHLYTLTTSDRGHMFAILESLQDTCERLRKYKHKEKIYAVLSEIRDAEFKDVNYYKDQINERKELIQKELSDQGIEVEILQCIYQQDYYESCRSIDPKMFGYFGYKIEGVH